MRKEKKDENEEKREEERYTLHDFREIMKKFVEERGWEPYHKPKDVALALSVECKELLEFFLFKPDTYIPQEDKFLDEIADVFLYTIALVNSLEVEDFAKIVLQKMEKNRKKYPTSIFSGGFYYKR